MSDPMTDNGAKSLVSGEETDDRINMRLKRISASQMREFIEGIADMWDQHGKLVNTFQGDMYLRLQRLLGVQKERTREIQPRPHREWPRYDAASAPRGHINE